MIINMLIIINISGKICVRGGNLNDLMLLELYLKKVKESICKKKFTMEPEDKRMLTKLGISYKEAIHIIENLQPTHYVSGPKQDHLNAEQSVYVFGYSMDDCELYIKLTFKEKESLFILSFHEAKYQMQYPYR